METTLEGSAAEGEKQSHETGRAVGRPLTESSLNERAESRQQHRLRCCGRAMRAKGCAPGCDLPGRRDHPSSSSASLAGAGRTAATGLCQLRWICYCTNLSEPGALAVTALRAHDLNNRHHFWNTLTIAP